MKDMLIIPLADNSNGLVMKFAGECAGCGTSHKIFRNRDGRTFCLACSGANEKHLEATSC